MAGGLARGIEQFGESILWAARERRLKQMQDAQIALAKEEETRKRQEAEDERAASENLANIQSLKHGVWPGKKPVTEKPFSPGMVNIPGSAPTMLPESPIEVEREPTSKDFSERVVSEEHSALKKGPKLALQYFGLEGKERDRLLRADRTKAQIARIKGMEERAKKLDPALAASIQLIARDPMLPFMSEEELSAKMDSVSAMIQSFNDGKGKSTPVKGKTLDPATAKAILQEAGGDKNKARQIAKERGYTF